MWQTCYGVTVNKVVHTLANTSLTYHTTRCFSLIIVGKVKDKTLEYTIPSHVAPPLHMLPLKVQMACEVTPKHSMHLRHTTHPRKAPLYVMDIHMREPSICLRAIYLGL
jgi:hypothetical protein